MTLELLQVYTDLLNRKDELKDQLAEIEKAIKDIEPTVAQVVESIGDRVTRDGWNIGFKTWRSVKLEEDADRNYIAQQLKADESTAYLVEEKFNLNSVSSHYLSEENSPLDLPLGLRYSEVVSLHPTRSTKK